MRQCKWSKLLKNYDMMILYHPGKTNLVLYALRRNAICLGSLALLLDFDYFFPLDIQCSAKKIVRLEIFEFEKVLVCVEAQSMLLEKIKDHQLADEKLIFIQNRVLRGKARETV